MNTSTPFIKRWAQALWIGALALCPVAAKAQYWADANNDGILDYCIPITPDSRVQVGFDPECCGKEYSVTYQFWGSANTHYYIQGYAGGQWHILNYLCLTNADLVTADWPEGQTCDTYGSYRCVALTPPTITLASQTHATVPANRARTLIGVGEQVDVSLPAGHAGPVTWQLQGGGALQNATGNSVVYVAPDVETTATVTATGNGSNYEIQFTVIKPTGVLMKQYPNTNIVFVRSNNQHTIGFRGQVYILPNTVSFENIEIQEQSCLAQTTGYYTGLLGYPHPQGVWAPMASNTQDGTLLGTYDTVQGPTITTGAPYSDGTFLWRIPWSYRVGGGAAHPFADIDQLFTIDSNGTLSVSKGGFSVSRTLSDPEVTSY